MVPSSEAERSIRGIAVTNANYEVAISTIKERFGNEQTVIFAHFDELFRLPASHCETSKLRLTYDDCERHIRGLEALGVTEDKFGIVFVPLILSKLPEEIRVDLNRKNGCQRWELKNLRQLLKEEIVARELGENRTTKVADWRPKFKIAANHGTAEALVSNSRTTSGPRCVFCDQSHYSDECRKHPDLQSRKLKLRDRCFACLRKGHLVTSCPRPSTCFYCKRKHHRSLCPSKFGNGTTDQAMSVGPADFSVQSLKRKSEATSATSMLLSPGQRVLMQTASTIAENPEVRYQSHPIRILLDTGSQRSFITSDLMRKLCLKSQGFDTIVVATFSAEHSKTMKVPRVKLSVKLIDGSYKEIIANVVPTISCPINKVAVDIEKYSILKEVPLADSVANFAETVIIDLLLGNDYYLDIVTQERVSLDEGLMMLKSTFGWIVTGKIDAADGYGQNENLASSLFVMDLDKPMQMETDMERFWKLEEIGIKDKGETIEDDVALDRFNETVKFESARYQVTWPWKEEVPDLPENYELAYGRLKSLMRRLSPTPELLKKYDAIIQEQQKLGIIEKVTDTTVQYSRRHYIPHHCVITPMKTTTKVRIVYDASAKTRPSNMSLNECLFRGPVLLKDLCGLLLRFRLQPIAIVSDIEKAFLQVGLQESERDVTRFLWLDNNEVFDLNNNLAIYRFCRVPFGVISSPFLLAATVAHHLKHSKGDVAKDIIKNIYVDNVFGGAASTEHAFEFYTEAKRLFNQASMNLREWASNCKEMIEKLPEKDRVKETVVKVLGLPWDTTTDVLKVVSPNPDQTETSVLTKRKSLCLVSQVFDPLGFFSPVTMRAKILIQSLWRENKSWDEELPKNLIWDWAEICKDLNEVSNHSVQRFIGISPNQMRQTELHCFCDASSKAYACCVYLRVENVVPMLIFSKSRLAPLKELSLPRLELMASLIGIRALKFVSKELKAHEHLGISKTVLWPDSKCVLHWIKSKKLMPVFIENRLKEIRSLSHVKFSYVPSEDNPADLPSRGSELQVVVNSTLWWHGPTWLSKIEASWPKDIETESFSSTEVSSDLEAEDSSQLMVSEEPKLKDVTVFDDSKTFIGGETVSSYCVCN